MPPGAGVTAGRRPPGGLGLDAGEDAPSSRRRERAATRGSCRCRLVELLGVGAQVAFVVDGDAHADRGVFAVAVVLVDPGRDAGTGLGLVAKRSRARSSNSSVQCQDSMTALSRADPTLPIDCLMSSRLQAARKVLAVYSADSTGGRNTSTWR